MRILDMGNAFALSVALAALTLAACVSKDEPLPPWPLASIPDENQFCLEAQRVVARTEHPLSVIIHGSFDEFVKSKAVIDPPTIQQYTWHQREDENSPRMISCKLKGSDHLNEAFGPGTAGPESPCQDMNRAIYRLVAETVDETPYAVVIFDAAETVRNEEQPGMTGPDWLAPFAPAYLGNPGNLHIRSKGFQVGWSDPRFADAPARFRGIHYCHFLAPEYMADLLSGAVQPGQSYGQAPDLSKFQDPGG